MVWFPSSVLADADPVDEQTQWIQSAYHNSLFYENVEKFSDAINALVPVYKAYPKGYTVNLRLGWLSYRLGRLSNSKAYYEVAMQVVPTSIEAKLGYLLPLLAQEHFKEAEQTCYQILHDDYYNFYGNLRLIYALQRQDKTDLVLKVVEKMLARFPANTELLVVLAQVYHKQGKTDQAVRVFSDVLTLDPVNVLAKEYLGLRVPNKVSTVGNSDSK